MAVLNPPRVLPGLGLPVINFLMESRSSWDEAGLIETFKPVGVNEADGASQGITNTLSALRAIGLVEMSGQGVLTVSGDVIVKGSPLGRDDFRRLLLSHVINLSRDGDPWAVGDGEASTSGARDLSRALSWFLAQDALGVPLTWDYVQKLQAEQFGANKQSQWALLNDTRWNAFSRWVVALGFAQPSVVRSASGLVPLPTQAIADAVGSMPAQQLPVRDFLSALAQKLPVLPGGIIRDGLVARLGVDPDPGLLRNALDTSVAQVLRILEIRGELAFSNLADADGVLLSPYSQRRTTHITVKGRNIK